MCGPEAVLATNTSVMSPTEIASKSEQRERIIGTHWWNPPFLIPLVEVVQTEETAPWVIQLTMDLHRAIGKHPVHAKKDVPGFIANRLQHALWREAISIVEHGIADAATVDESLKYGPGLRLSVSWRRWRTPTWWALDLVLSIHDYVLKHLEDSHEAFAAAQDRRWRRASWASSRAEWAFRTGPRSSRRRLRADLLDYLTQGRPRDEGEGDQVEAGGLGLDETEYRLKRTIRALPVPVSRTATSEGDEAGSWAKYSLT